MGLAAGMKNLSDELLASFKNRIKENEELVNDVQKTLDGFRKDHQEMAAVLTANAKSLRKDLNQGEKERMNTYKNLMADIHGTISTIQKEVVEIQTSTFNLITEFNADRSQMAKDQNESFAQNRADRMQDEHDRMLEFNALMSNINADIQRINDDVTNILNDTNQMLSDFDKEHQEMSAELRAELGNNLAERVKYTNDLLKGFQKRLSEISRENQTMAKNLRKDLNNGETSRLNNYKGLMKEIHTSIKGIQKQVKDVQKATAGLIGNYSQERSDGQAEWSKMQATIAEFRKTGVIKETTQPVVKAEKKKEPVIEVEVKPVDEVPVEEVKEVPVEVKEIPVEVKIKEVPKPVVPMTLDEKVLDYINKHPNGLKISEMEQPLGETRMKLGFVAKALLEEGKVQKMDNVYFPLK